jgi:hypothetical protein
MLKKLLKSIFKEAMSSKHHHYHYTSDAWKHSSKYSKYSHMGHHHYKRKHKSGSFFSSFLSS